MGKVLKIREVGNPVLTKKGILFLKKVKEKDGFATMDNINKYNLRRNQIMKVGMNISEKAM